MNNFSYANILRPALWGFGLLTGIFTICLSGTLGLCASAALPEGKAPFGITVTILATLLACAGLALGSVRLIKWRDRQVARVESFDEASLPEYDRDLLKAWREKGAVTPSEEEIEAMENPRARSISQQVQAFCLSGGTRLLARYWLGDVKLYDLPTPRPETLRLMAEHAMAVRQAERDKTVEAQKRRLKELSDAAVTELKKLTETAPRPSTIVLRSHPERLGDGKGRLVTGTPKAWRVGDILVEQTPIHPGRYVVRASFWEIRLIEGSPGLLGETIHHLQLAAEREEPFTEPSE